MLGPRLLHLLLLVQTVYAQVATDYTGWASFAGGVSSRAEIQFTEWTSADQNRVVVHMRGHVCHLCEQHVYVYTDATEVCASPPGLQLDCQWAGTKGEAAVLSIVTVDNNAGDTINSDYIVLGQNALTFPGPNPGSEHWADSPGRLILSNLTPAYLYDMILTTLGSSIITEAIVFFMGLYFALMIVRFVRRMFGIMLHGGSVGASPGGGKETSGKSEAQAKPKSRYPT